jgi:hypothetical protein
LERSADRREQSGTALPDLPINVVVRADNGSTSFVFSQHLSAIATTSARPSAPTRCRTAGRQVEGQRGRHLQHLDDARLDRLRLRQSQKMPMAELENKSGQFTPPRRRPVRRRSRPPRCPMT